MERKGEKNILPRGGPKGWWKLVVAIFELANRPLRAPMSHSNEGVEVVDTEQLVCHTTPWNAIAKCPHCVEPIHFTGAFGAAQTYAAVQRKDAKRNRVRQKSDAGHGTRFVRKRPQRPRAQYATYTQRNDPKKEDNGLMGRTLNKKGGPIEKKRFFWVEEEKWHVGSASMEMSVADFNPTRDETSDLKNEGSDFSEAEAKQKEI